MGRPRMCSCNCDEPPPPDCFGCTDPETWFPSVWQLDMPSVMTVPSNASCGPLTATIPGGGFAGLLDIRHTLSSEVEFPRIPQTSLLLVDDRPILDYAWSWVTCVWLSNDYRMANFLYWNGIPWNRAECIHAGHYPGAVKSPDWFAPTPWYYYELPTVGISPNRSRAYAVSDHPNDPSCGTEVDPALPDLSSPRYSCRLAPYGTQWQLSIERTGSTYKLVATLRYWLRLAISYFVEEYLLGGIFYPATGWRPASGQTGFVNFFNAPGQVVASYGYWPKVPPLTGDDCKSTLFPNYGTDVNLHNAPNLVRYEKVINCATDFDGTPVVLSKAYDYKAVSGSTKTIIEAMGISASPSFITLTPVI